MIILFLFLNIKWIDTKYTDFQQGTYDADLYISRRLQTETNYTDSGCIEYHTRFDANNDGWYDLISSEAWGPNLTIWLGSSSGYSYTNCIKYPIFDGGGCELSDLNMDGYPELIHSGYNMHYCTIYWGTPNGPSLTDTTVLPNRRSEAVYIADIDKDTYLDISLVGGDGFLRIYWGSDSIYSVANYMDVDIGPHTAHNIEMNDLDKNGYLDIILIQWARPHNIVILYQNRVRIFDRVELDFGNAAFPHGLSIGDLNKDGYTDIVGTGYVNIRYSSIYWGSARGYSNINKLDINPGRCYGGSAIADFNNDGWLDILYYRGNGIYPHPFVPSIIYYNLGYHPYFYDTYTQEIGKGLKATGGQVADFNKDGSLDIFINNGDSTYRYSCVFYGPDFTSYDSLPAFWDHHGCSREIRHASYYSRIYTPQPDSLIINGNVSWIANTLGNSQIKVYVRTGNTPLPDDLWTDWYIVTNGGNLPPQILNKKYIQYKVDFIWENPSELPTFERIEWNFNYTENQNLKDDDLQIKIIGRKVIFYNRNTEIKIYDITGKSINLPTPQDNIFEITFDRSGIYFIKTKHLTKKIIIL